MQHKEFVDFGNSKVTPQAKQPLVNQVFDNVAAYYDVMNDAMSLGMQRYWKSRFIASLKVQPHEKILDLASGSCDIVKLLAAKTDASNIYASDINANMLTAGRTKLINLGILIADYLLFNAENIPLAATSFDLITMSFGLRNTTDKLKVLQQCYKLLKPGGRFAVLEFSQPENPTLNKLVQFYNAQALPFLGKLIANDTASYEYLAASIANYLKPKQVIDLFYQAKFNDVEQIKLSGNIVNINIGYKY